MCQELEERGRVKFIKLPLLLIVFFIGNVIIFDLDFHVKDIQQSMFFSPHLLKPEEITWLGINLIHRTDVFGFFTLL